MQSWSEQELSQVDLGDERLNKRLMKMVEDRNPVFRKLVVTGQQPKVKASSIIDGHVESIKQRFLGQDTILAIQDTTDMNYTNHPSTEGLGYLDHPSIKRFSPSAMALFFRCCREFKLRFCIVKPEAKIPIISNISALNHD